MNDRANKKVIVDAGHGGNDGGASGNNILEKDYTLKISKYISNRLNQLGIPNELTRNSDETLDQNARIKRIKNLTNLDKDVIIVSNHLNAGGSDISNYEGLNLKKLFTTTFLIFFSTATWAWFIPANFSFWHF